MKGLFYDFSDLNETSACELAREVVDCAERYGMSGDAWANWLAYRLLTAENAFSIACEKGTAGGTISKLAREEIKEILPLFSRDSELTKTPEFKLLRSYEAGRNNRDMRAERTIRLAQTGVRLADSGEISAVDEFVSALVTEYETGGAGEIGMCEAFRLVAGRATDEYRLAAVPNFEPKSFATIVGYEGQKHALTENTRAFIEGRACNNVLLYGDAGTGKSTSVKALLPEFRGGKLKIIEIYKHQYSAIARLMSDVENRGCKFILFLDDLSFEEFETEYKYFKAILDGGLGNRPENVVVYATSNRMHLIKESFSDRNDISRDDIHRSDTVEEKISLSARFGLSLFYPAPDTKEYLSIVHELAAAEGIVMPPERLDMLAMRWATMQNKKSGRTAEQFIKNLLADPEEE